MTSRHGIAREGPAVSDAVHRTDTEMHLRYALLALLGEGEAHGYELLKRFNRRIGPFWHPNIGQVHPNPKHTRCHPTKPAS